MSPIPQARCDEPFRTARFVTDVLFVGPLAIYVALRARGISPVVGILLGVVGLFTIAFHLAVFLESGGRQ